MNRQSFLVLYLVGVLATYLIRIPSLILNARAQKPNERMTQAERMKKEGYLPSILMILWFVASVVLPALNTAIDWFDRFDFNLPIWCGYLGLIVFIILLWLLWRAHSDLNRSWSAVVQIKRDQQLITDGIYRSIRHPIYSAHLLWGLAQVLMLPNWVCGFPGFLLIAAIILLRIPREEKLLLKQYGEDYRKYMQNTGALFPRRGR